MNPAKTRIFLQKGVAIGAFVLLFYVGIRYFIPLFLPFLLAVLLAVLLREPSLKLAKMAKIPVRIASSLLAAMTALSIFAFLGFLLWKLVLEGVSFVETLLDADNPLFRNLQGMFKRTGDFITSLPFLRGENTESVKKEMMGTFFDMMKNMAVTASAGIPSVISGLISAVPSFFLSLVVTILASVYFCADYDNIRSAIGKHLKGKKLAHFVKIKKMIRYTFGKLFRSYCILFLFTFAVLLLGFALLQEKYAFLLALFTAMVDSLPVFGTGTVLIPMGFYHIFIGNYKMAIGLFILYLAVMVGRQILEPKIMGKEMGVHPLLMLLCLYMGFRLFGIIGMVLSPIMALTVKMAVRMFVEKKEVPYETSL